MKRTLGKKLTSVFLAGTLLASTILSGTVVFAGDTYPYVGEAAKGENQPYQHGYRVEDIMDWSPETDPYAELLKAEVPLQNRNAAFAATQANPNLTAEAQYFTLTGDYGNAFFNSYPYTNEFSTHVFNFWQYVDYYASWHGMPSVGTPEELNDIEDERNATDGNAWKRRYFEFGLVNLPNPAYTNAAHKNGVLSLGCMFQPRAYQNFEVMLYTDENGRYPVADKLTEMAEYYGFDGYFFNMEGRTYDANDREKLKGFLAQMRADGMYIQWYNAGSFSTDMLTSAKKNDTENATRYTDSIFIEYYMEVPGDEATEPYGLDKYEVAFNGFEAGANRWRNNFDEMLKDGVMNGSIATLGTDFVQTGLENQAGVDAETGYKLFERELDEYQWKAFQRERMWWSGGNQDPTNPQAVSDSDVEVTYNQQDGVAKYIAERSVVNGDAFVTNFNTGHGLEYMLNGELSNSAEWSNIGIQDILPTWQWWFETDGTKLNADFDYGSKYRKVKTGGEELAFDFDLVGAYNGGSSLAVYGALDAKNFLHLYKTDLTVNDASQMSVTYKKTSNDAASMKLGVIFADDTDNVVELAIAGSEAASEGWTTSVVDMSGYAGKTIAAFGLVFDGTADDYQMNIGQMKYTSGAAQKPAAPTGLQIEKAYGNTNEMVIRWDLASYDEVKQYNIYAVKEGKEIYLGGAYDDIYYIKDLEEAIAENEEVSIDSVTVTPSAASVEKGGSLTFDAVVNGSKKEAGQVTIRVKAVSADGTESDPATASYNYNDAVKNIAVDNSTDGQLVVTWDGGQADVTVTTMYEESPRSWTASGNGSATVTVPTGADANGAYYTMKIETAEGFATYDGRLPDSYCAPYDGKIWGDGRFTQPSTSEWHELHYQVVTDGVRGTEDSYTRGVKSHGEQNNDWAMFMPFSESVDGAYIWLLDYNGNKSEEVYISNSPIVSVFPGTSTIQASNTLQMTAKVERFDGNQEVIWSVEGATAKGTVIDENGLLTVDMEETANRITVRAALKENTIYSGTAIVNIQPAYMLMPDHGEVYRGYSTQFQVECLGEALPGTNYEWSIESTYGELKEGTQIDDTGLLTVDSEENAYGILVTATKIGDEKIVYSIRVKPVDPLSIRKEGSSILFTGEKAEFIPIFQGEEANPNDFNWTVTNQVSESTDFETPGILTIAEDESASSLTVTAEKKDNPNVSATITGTVMTRPDGLISVGATLLGTDFQYDIDTLFDMNEKTGAMALEEPTWVAFDLGEEYQVNRFKVLRYNYYGMVMDINKASLEILKDGIEMPENPTDEFLADNDNWTTVTTVSEATGADIDVEVTATGRYFRVQIIEGCDYYGFYRACAAAEIELYGEAASSTANISAEIVEETITLEEPEAFAEPTAIAYTALAANEPAIPQEVTWTVEGATSPSTRIDTNGKLYVAYNEQAEYLTVRATSVADPSKSGTATVRVVEDSYEPATEYYIDVQAGNGGSVTPGSGMYAIGSKQTFVITPDAGYAIDQVLVDGKAVGISGNSLTLYVDEPCRITVSFRKAGTGLPGIEVEKPNTGSTATPNPQTGDSWFRGL